MTSFKPVITAAFVVAVLAVNVSSFSFFGSSNTQPAQSNNLIVGERQYNDKLVYQESISIGASLIGRKVIHEQTFNATRNHVITQVLALDQATDGTGATAVVTGGGSGQETIKLRFKSQRFHGIYFTVQIYAKPRF